MKGNFNPELEVGDVVICYYMEGENSVPPGTSGVVKRVGPDPFEKNAIIYSVDWENGSKLALLSVTDIWKKVPVGKINESFDWDYIVNNDEILILFDWRFLREFLEKIRESGIVNMFGSAPLLYCGREHIDRYYGEGREDDEAFQEVLDDADKAKQKMIEGILKYMEKKNLDVDDINLVNRYANSLSQKILGIYIAWYNVLA